MLEIGIIGVNKISLAFLQLLNKNRDIFIKAVADEKINTKKDSLEMTPLPYLYDDSKKLLEDPDLDLILIFQPTNITGIPWKERCVYMLKQNCFRLSC